MILGIGLDLVEVERVRGLLEKYSGRFARRVFTEGERGYCDSMPDPALHYAARFAAKEAFLKALGTGLSHGISWQEIEVQRLSSGKPVLKIHGKAAEELAQLGASRSHISLSHTQGHGCAVVILENG